MPCAAKVRTAIDGRGGDGGIDIDVTVKKTGQLVKILQVKYFPEATREAIGIGAVRSETHSTRLWPSIIPPCGRW